MHRKFASSYQPSSSLFSRGTLQAMRFRAARPSSATIFLTLSWLLERWKDACRRDRLNTSSLHFIKEPRKDGVEKYNMTYVTNRWGIHKVHSMGTRKERKLFFKKKSCSIFFLLLTNNMKRLTCTVYVASLVYCNFWAIELHWCQKTIKKTSVSILRQSHIHCLFAVDIN